MNENHDQQQQELECVQSMFYESGDVIVRDTNINKSQGDSSPLIYTIRIPLTLTDYSLHHLSLECTCPITYPSSARPQLYIRTSFSRNINDIINMHLMIWLHQQSLGELCIIDTITWIQSEGINIINEEVEKEKLKQIEPKVENKGSSQWMREFIWFHHIYSKAKKKFISDLTSQLDLHVVMKVGKPGIIVVEGDEDDVKQWISHVRGLSWQKMSSRLTQCPISTLRLPRGLTDMTELSDLLDHMRSYGLEEEMRSVCRWEENDDKEQDANSDEENTAASKQQSKQTQPAKPANQQQKNNNKSHSKTATATATTATASSTDSASSALPSCIQSMTPTRIRLTISVKPNAASTEIVDITDECLSIRLAARPREGEANAELLRYIGEILNVRSSQVTLVSGGQSRHKQVVVDGVNMQQIQSQLQAYLQKT